MGQPQWSVYLVRCGSGALYTGIATDVVRRLTEHRQARGKGAKYLRGKGPLRLVFEKKIGTKGLALSVESRIKKLPKTRIAFIAIKPSLKRWKLAGEMEKANLRIKKRCDRSKLLDYLDIWTPMLGDDGKPRPELFLEDGLHLNAQGYALWTSVIRPFVDKE